MSHTNIEKQKKENKISEHMIKNQKHCNRYYLSTHSPQRTQTRNPVNLSQPWQVQTWEQLSLTCLLREEPKEKKGKNDLIILNECISLKAQGEIVTMTKESKQMNFFPPISTFSCPQYLCLGLQGWRVEGRIVVFWCISRSKNFIIVSKSLAYNVHELGTPNYNYLSNS